ncbi:MAG: hypothetical protein QOE63_1366 [Acidimicrobiaceae bacterium]
MLHLLDVGVAAYLRAELGPSANGLDVVFTAPAREWSAGLTRPTINCYLWSIAPAAQGNVSGFEQVVEGDRAFRRAALPRVDLRYLVTAWADDPRDEHQVLGALVQLLARPCQLASEYLPEPLASITPLPLVQLAGAGIDDRADFWTALDGRYRPGLDVCITAAVDRGVRQPLALAPTEVHVVVADQEQPQRESRRSWFRRAS